MLNRKVLSSRRKVRSDETVRRESTDEQLHHDVKRKNSANRTKSVKRQHNWTHAATTGAINILPKWWWKKFIEQMPLKIDIIAEMKSAAKSISFNLPS